jgi:DNA-binding MarR family transcriptional regulator
MTYKRTSSVASEPLVGGLLRLLSESIREHILHSVRAVGYQDIRAAHLSVFQFPSPEGATPSELAARGRVSKQAMNYLLSELEDRGYLRRQVARDDARSRTVLLTPRGRRLVRAMRRSVTDVETAWAHHLGQQRFNEMKAALAELYEADRDMEAVA